MTQGRWTAIREDLAQDIADGVLQPGARLPNEGELARQYKVGRHSVRRAVADLAKEGRVSVEQGRGTFVLPQPKIQYAIGKRTRLRQNLSTQGIDVAGEALGTEILPALGPAADALQLCPGEEMSVTRRITLADGIPVAIGALFHHLDRFPEFAERRAAMGSVSDVYRSYGIDDYLRASTDIIARTATAAEAKELRQHPDLPVMVVRSLDALTDGTPIAFGEVIWSAERVQFSIVADQD